MFIHIWSLMLLIKVISTEVDYENVSSNDLLITGFVKNIIQVTCSLMLLKLLIKLWLY